jgi:S1-C subfamily serine protease
MKRQTFCLVTCSGFFTCLLSIGDLDGVIAYYAIAQDKNEFSTEENIYNIARSVTVRVFANQNTGSGTLVHREGEDYTVLTNAHVLLPGNPLYIQTPDGRLHLAEKVEITALQGKDLALLKFRSIQEYTTAIFSENLDIEIHEPVIAAGFPNNTGMFVFTTGEVSFLLEEALEEGYQIGYTNDVEQGMSGGPILNREGKLVGVNGRLPNPVLAPFNILDENPTLIDEQDLGLVGSSLGIPISFATHLIDQYIHTEDSNQTQSILNKESSDQLNSAQAQSIDAIFKQGRQSFLDADYEGAIQNFNQVVDSDSSLAEAYYYRGLSYLFTNDFEAALSDLDKVVTINSDYAAAYAMRGVVFAELEDFAKADAEIEAAFQIDPSSFEAYYARGFNHRLQKQHSEAIEEFSNAIQVSPDHELSYRVFFERALSYFSLDSVESALDDLSTSIELFPENPRAYAVRSIARLLTMRLDVAGAFEDANAAIALSNRNETPEVYAIRGWVGFALGSSYEEIFSDLNKALELFEQQKREDTIDFFEQLDLDSTFPIASNISYVEKSQQVEETAKKVTVRIDKYRQDNKNFEGNGSGVIIAANNGTYYVLTANHVVSENADLRVVTSDGSEHVASLTTEIAFQDVDLAVLSFKSNINYPIAEISTYEQDDFLLLAQQVAQPVFVSGWPQQEATRDWPFLYFSPGRFVPETFGLLLTQNSDSFTKGYGIAYTNITLNGMSGGPLFDIEGRLIGIHGRTENLGFVLEQDGFIDAANVPLGFSLGIPISRFLEEVDQAN